MSPDLHFVIEVGRTLSEEDRATIERGLVESAHSLGIEPPKQDYIAVCLRDGAGVLLGGLVGGIMWGWVEISLLWIDKRLRAKGHGTELLNMSETEAVRRGCHHSRLETFDVAALRFYEQRGYERFGSIPDCPTGHTRYLLVKDLRLIPAT